MQLVAAALLACGCVSLAEVPDWPPAEDFMATVSCSQSANVQGCADIRANWTSIYSKAIAGKPDSQRTVSLCLSTGCDGAVVENHMLGCAWRHVIATSENAASGNEDLTELTRFCDAKLLDEAGRKAALEQAKNWLILLDATAER